MSNIAAMSACSSDVRFQVIGRGPLMADIEALS